MIPQSAPLRDLLKQRLQKKTSQLKVMQAECSELSKKKTRSSKIELVRAGLYTDDEVIICRQ